MRRVTGTLSSQPMVSSFGSSLPRRSTRFDRHRNPTVGVRSGRNTACTEPWREDAYRPISANRLRRMMGPRCVSGEMLEEC